MAKRYTLFKSGPVSLPLTFSWSNGALVGSIGFVWFSRDHQRGYLGPGASWWGADLALVPYGKGRCLVSQLRIVENLGKDPVADKLRANIVKFVTNGLQATAVSAP
jgi:hypothetical protein